MDEGLSATGRRMVGYALKWGQPAWISSGGKQFTETFRRGAFLNSIARGKVRLCLEHAWDDVVARQSDGTLTLVEDTVGLRVDAWANGTPAGDEALDAVRCRYQSGLSVYFEEPILKWTDIDGVPFREVVSCSLREVSVCRNPAYRSSSIAAGKMRIDRFLADVAELDRQKSKHGRVEAAEAALRASFQSG